MDENDFQALVIERLGCIDGKIADIRERLARIESSYRLMWRVIILLGGAVLAKLGIDVSGLM